MKKTLWVLAFSLSLTVGCGGEDDGNGTGGSYDGGMTSAAMQALPLFNAVEGLTRIPVSARAAVGGEITDQYILNFFKLECHMESQNDCPGDIEAVDENKYTVTTLIGLIYHAEMKMMDVFREGYETCSVGEGSGEITVSGASFASDDGDDPDKYIIDFYDQLSCVGHQSDPAASYFTYGTGTDKLVMIDTRKHDLFSDGWNQSDIWQVYLSMDAESAEHILAFNSVNINEVETGDDFAGRAVLLVNLQTRKFLVRYATMSGYVIAAGKGGISPAGVFEPGVYYVHTATTPEEGVCIDNATQLELDVSQCDAENASWNSNAEAAEYLEMTATEEADLAGFLAFFQAGPTAENLAADAYPTLATDAVNIPDRIE